METILLVFAVSALSLLTGGSLVIWSFLRSGGYAERMLIGRDKKLKSLSDSSTDLTKRMVLLEANMEKHSMLSKSLNDAIQSRMSSFEARYGKQTKREKEESMQAEFFETLSKQNNKAK